MAQSVLIVSHAETTARFLPPLIDAYQMHNCKVRFASNDEYGSQLIKEYLPGIEHVVLPLSRSLSLASIWRGVRSLGSILDEGDGVVHIHGPLALLQMWAALLLRRKKSRPIVVYHAHGLLGSASLVENIGRLVERACCVTVVDELLLISREDVDTLAAWENDPKKPTIAYVPGVGVDAQKFRRDLLARTNIRREMGVSSTECVVAYVGRLTTDKGLDTIVSAFSRPELAGIRLWLVGDAARSERNVATTALSAAASMPNVSILGRRDDVHRILSAADIFVLPSPREGLSVAIMEAMASSLPVIARGIRGNRELLREGAGLLVPAHAEPQDFVRTIEELAGDPEKRAMMGDLASSRIAAEYDAALVRSRYTEWLSKVAIFRSGLGA